MEMMMPGIKRQVEGQTDLIEEAQADERTEQLIDLMTVASLQWKLVYKIFFSMCNTAQLIPIIYILSRSCSLCIDIILKLLTNLLAITMPY